MGRISEYLAAEVRACLAGLSEADQLTEVGRIVRPDLVGAEVQMRAPAETVQSFFTDFTETRGREAGPGVVLSAAERERIAGMGLDPAEVERHTAAFKAERAEVAAARLRRVEAGAGGAA
jgi:hypothetical protein